jgi:AcrR family transcriptional regulator
VPKQGRSRQTRQSLAKSALELFEHKGYFNTTSRDIADRAGTSVGSFYVYFEDKRDVLLELITDIKGVGLARTRELLTGTGSASPWERIQLLLSSLSTLKRLHPYVWAQAKLLAHFDSQVAEVLGSFASELTEEIAAAIAGWAPEVRVADPEVAAEVVLQTAGVVDHVNGSTDRRLTAGVRESLYRYLFPVHSD